MGTDGSAAEAGLTRRVGATSASLTDEPIDKDSVATRTSAGVTRRGARGPPLRDMYVCMYVRC
eukprot:scaffold1231_cov369-Prasinococcus_capsulatus_cf.AAC.2